MNIIREEATIMWKIIRTNTIDFTLYHIDYCFTMNKCCIRVVIFHYRTLFNNS